MNMETTVMEKKPIDLTDVSVMRLRVKKGSMYRRWAYNIF